MADHMNEIPKIVFSSTLETADWNNTRLVRENAVEEVAKLEQQQGKDLAIFRSSDLTASFLRLGLIDELRLMMNPMLLGAGRSVYRTLGDRLPLKLDGGP